MLTHTHAHAQRSSNVIGGHLELLLLPRVLFIQIDRAHFRMFRLGEPNA